MTSDTVASTVRTPGAGIGAGAEHPDAFRPDDEHPGPAHECLGRGAVEDVGGADEVGDEAVGRILVDVAGLADLLDAPVVEHRQPVAQRQRLVLVVGDDDERDADLALNRLELDLHLLAQLEVERAERLVEQQHARPPDQGTGQRHALTLAARQLRGPARRLVGRAAPCRARRRCGAGARPWARRRTFRPYSTFCATVMCGNSAYSWNTVLTSRRRAGNAGHVDAAEFDDARGGLLEARDHAQHRGLARTRRAQDREQFTVVRRSGRRRRPPRSSSPNTLRTPIKLDLRIVNGGSHIRVRL